MTIASEIQRIKTNIANAYDMAEAKGATMPATKNSDNLSLTIDTISGGGIEVDATNYSGSDITSSNKVWINPYNYAANNTRAIAPQNTAYGSYGSALVSKDSLYYFWHSNNSNFPDGYYSSITNTRISVPGLSSGAYNPIDLGNSMFLLVGKYNQAEVYDMYLHKPSGRVTISGSYTTGQTPVYNKPGYFVKWATGTTLDYVEQYDLATMTQVSQKAIIGVPSGTWNAKSPSHNPAVMLDDSNIFVVCAYNKGILLTYDDVNDNWAYNRTVTISGLSSYPTPDFYGVTSDGLCLLQRNKNTYLGNILSGGNATTSTISGLLDSNYNTLSLEGNCIFCFNPMSATASDRKIFRYDSSTHNFSQVTVESTSSNLLAGVGGNANILVYMQPNSSNKNAVLNNVEAISGYYLSGFSGATVDTVTGIANENIKYCSSGKVSPGGNL